MKYPVLLPNIFNHPFTYESDLSLSPGEYVKVPFGKSIKTGIVWDQLENTDKKNFKIKKVIKKLNLNPLNQNTLKFLNWFSDYNLIPRGMSLKLHLLSSEAVENLSNNEFHQYSKLSNPKKYILSSEQKIALKEIDKIQNKFRVHLLQGTTGSGKTIVYFNAIKKK